MKKMLRVRNLRKYAEKFLSRKLFFLLKGALRSVAWRTDEFYKLIAKIRGYDYLQPDLYDIYISGFPRSGNHFITGAISCLSESKIKVNPVNHLPPFTRKAVREGVPSVILVRNPIDSCVSWSLYDDCSLSHALSFYNMYHRIMLDVSNRSCVLRFDEFTDRLKPSILVLNRFFSLSLREDFSEKAMRDEIFSNVPRWSSAKAPQPTEERRKKAALLKAELLESSAYKLQLQKAEEIYRVLCEVSDLQKESSSIKLN